MFAIDQDNCIGYVFEDGEAAGEAGAPFSSLTELEVIAADRKWTKQTVTDIWNGFAGTAGPFADLKPQKCFRNLKYGLSRLWDAIQRLVPSDAASEAETPVDAILEGNLEDTPVKKKTKPKAEKTKAVKPKKEKAKGKSKRDEVIRLISREKGASLDELVNKMGWERHTIRGLLSTLVSKHGLKIESTKSETKGRVYRLVA